MATTRKSNKGKYLAAAVVGVAAGVAADRYLATPAGRRGVKKVTTFGTKAVGGVKSAVKVAGKTYKTWRP